MMTEFMILKKKKHSQSAGRIRSTIRWLLHEWKHKGFRQVQTTDFTSRTRRPDEDFGRKHLKVVEKKIFGQMNSI